MRHSAAIDANRDPARLSGAIGPRLHQCSLANTAGTGEPDDSDASGTLEQGLESLQLEQRGR